MSSVPEALAFISNMVSGLSTRSIEESAREAVLIGSVSNPSTLISMGWRTTWTRAPLWAHNVDKDAIVGAQHGQPLWAHNVDSHCGHTTWTAIVGAQRGQPLWAHNVDKGAIVGAQRGQPLWAHNVDNCLWVWLYRAHVVRH